MGRDEHRKPKGKKALSQTPKSQIVDNDNIDVEFSEELADAEDKEAQARAHAADKRAKNKSPFV
ncbi:YfhD family protein [Pueribacillus theae]|uniref:YfhD family protein n=1 Tax=Pueribacillus theae TaxID=2171751 RepID=A0A2U1JX02_9BACI|nr:YfhD family protein [Pueribacillus theae]PWA09741.1 YfhD family protein [Pueribacillus theae]